MAQDNLKQKTKKGLYWSAASNFANQGMRFVFGLILARLLSPDAYGVIGMLTVFLCVVQVFIDCGFSQALIAKQDRTQTDFSTEFYFNIGVGLIGYCLLFISAPFIADFYNMPLLTSVLRVVGLGVIINSLCVVQSAQFSIRLDFKTPAKIGVSTNLFSGFIGIILAYYGWGVWALVFQQLASGILYGILVWILAKWRPTFEFSKDSFKYLWNYGSKILASSIIQQVYDNLYPLVIGKFFSARQLGLYSRAQGFATLPSSNVSGILGSVTFPILSKINNDTPRLMRIYRQMIKTAAFIVFPLMLGLFAISNPLVKVLLNRQWYDCILILQLLCCALLWQPISAINLSILKVIGRTDILLKLEIIKRIAGIISIVCSVPFGIIGMCIGYIILYLFCFILNTIYISKITDTPLFVYFKDIVPPLLASISMGGIVLGIISFIESNLVSLIVGIIAGILCYYLFSRYFLKEQLKNALSLVKNKTI